MFPRLGALSTQPDLSIYTYLVTNTLIFHLFVLRIKQSHRAIGFVRHGTRYTTITHTANTYRIGYISTLVAD